MALIQHMSIESTPDPDVLKVCWLYTLELTEVPPVLACIDVAVATDAADLVEFLQDEMGEDIGPL